MAASEREELLGIASDLRAHLEWLRETGVREVPTVAKSVTPPPASRASESEAPQLSLRAAVRAAVSPKPQMPAPVLAPTVFSPQTG